MSLASDEDFNAVRNRGQVISKAVSAVQRKIDLNKVLAGKVASVRVEIGETDEGLMRRWSRKDLETMFQLIY